MSGQKQHGAGVACAAAGLAYIGKGLDALDNADGLLVVDLELGRRLLRVERRALLEQLKQSPGGCEAREKERR